MTRTGTNDPGYPTMDAAVNAVLQGFLERIQAILGDQFVGFYLYGSLALGDFDPHTSDIDFIVLTREALSEDHFAALHGMHADFDGSSSPWAGKIEAAYIPLTALNDPAQTGARYPQVEKDTALLWSPLEPGWAFQRYSLRERGVTVAGPAPHTLMEPDDPDAMRQAARIIVLGWQTQARDDPNWLDWARQSDSQTFLILTLCRLLYSLETGGVASKPGAARWVHAAVGKRWHALIESALAGAPQVQAGSDRALAETLNFLNFVIEREKLV